MFHVAIIFEFPTVNGGENSMLQVMEHLQEAGKVRFTAIIPGEGRLKDRLVKSGISYVQWSTHTTNDIRLSSEEIAGSLQEILAMLQPDVAHANSLAMSRILGPVGSNCSFACSGHLRDIMRLSRSAMNKIGQLDGIVAVSVATRTFHLAHGLAAPKFIVIHNGVAAVDSTRTCDWSIRSELDLPERSRLILNAGQIGLRKAQHTLIEAFSLISKEFPDCFLILAGERNSTKQESIEFEAKLECLARSPALRERVHLVGFVPDLAKMMPQFDLLVHTARQEPFGRVLLEASAGGIPIVATDVGGTREIITPGASGLLVPADDPHATAAAMRRLLTSSDLSTSYALAARADVLERFSVESSAEAMRAFWKELARTGR